MVENPRGEVVKCPTLLMVENSRGECPALLMVENPRGEVVKCPTLLMVENSRGECPARFKSPPIPVGESPRMKSKAMTDLSFSSQWQHIRYHII